MGPHPFFEGKALGTRLLTLWIRGVQPQRLDVSDGKPVYSKLSISSGVNVLRSITVGTAYNASDKHVSTLNLG